MIKFSEEEEIKLMCTLMDKVKCFQGNKKEINSISQVLISIIEVNARDTIKCINEIEAVIYHILSHIILRKRTYEIILFNEIESQKEKEKLGDISESIRKLYEIYHYKEKLWKECAEVVYSIDVVGLLCIDLNTCKVSSAHLHHQLNQSVLHARLIMMNALFMEAK